jgi:hypothetical protein
MSDVPERGMIALATLNAVKGTISSMVPFTLLRVTVLSQRAAVSAPVPVRLVVSVVAVSIAPPPIAPPPIAVSAVVPGLPVSVPAPPAVPVSPPALRSPQATSAKAITEPRIQDVRFMGNSLSTAEPRRSPLI